MAKKRSNSQQIEMDSEDPSTSKRCKMSDIEKFMEMDLESSQSVAYWVPLTGRRGEKKHVPFNVRGASDDPEECMRQIANYRSMRNSGQKKLWEEWKAMSRTEQKVFKERVKNLKMNPASLLEERRQLAGALLALSAAPIAYIVSCKGSCV
jgi:hypothetical protein